MIIQDSWFFRRILINWILVIWMIDESISKTNFPSIVIKKLWSKKFKVFSMLIVTKKPSLSNISQNSRSSSIKLPPSLVNLKFTYAVWISETIQGKVFLIRSDKACEINFVSTLSKEIGFQFSIIFLSLPFFSISFKTVCPCVLSCCISQTF